VIIMTVTTAAEALFVSSLQPSDHPTRNQVDAAVRSTLLAHGGACGCAAAFAAEYGEHPETSAHRMRWALSIAAQTSFAAEISVAA
jgi:uncharacterized membrane protein